MKEVDILATKTANNVDPDAVDEEGNPVPFDVNNLEDGFKVVYKQQVLTEEQKRHYLICNQVIPNLVAYRTLLHMMKIKEGRKELFVKKLEKLLDQDIPYQMAM